MELTKAKQRKKSLRYMSKYRYDYEYHNRLLEYKDFNDVEKIIREFILKKKNISLSDSFKDYMELVLCSKQLRTYVLIGFNRVKETLYGLDKNLSSKDIYDWILFDRFYIKYVGVLNEMVAKKVIETQLGIELVKANEILDTKYGVDYLDKDGNAYSIKSNPPYGKGLMYWDVQKSQFNRDFENKQFIKVITSTKTRRLKFNYKTELCKILEY